MGFYSGALLIVSFPQKCLHFWALKNFVYHVSTINFIKLPFKLNLMADISSKEKFDLKRFIKDISKYRGRHTELVTVYVPKGYNLDKVINQLQQEQGTAVNIKSASTRKNVIDALERMIQHLKNFKQTPPNGLAAFSGNVAEQEGRSDVQVFSLEPPVPLNVRIYRCDKNFSAKS